MLDRYLIPLAPFVLLAVALIACLVFFAALEKEIRRLKGQLAGRPQPDSSASGEVTAKIEDLTARVRDAEDRAGILPPPAPRSNSLNLNKRTQVIRLARKGEPAHHIAASLRIPRKEVDLLLKVYGISLTRSNEITI